jgi:hypothetical protein
MYFNFLAEQAVLARRSTVHSHPFYESIANQALSPTRRQYQSLVLAVVFLTNINYFTNAPAFNWDTCCHLELCLQLIAFHKALLVFVRRGKKLFLKSNTLAYFTGALLTKNK